MSYIRLHGWTVLPFGGGRWGSHTGCSLGNARANDQTYKLATWLGRLGVNRWKGGNDGIKRTGGGGCGTLSAFRESCTDPRGEDLLGGTGRARTEERRMANVQHQHLQPAGEPALLRDAARLT